MGGSYNEYTIQVLFLKAEISFSSSRKKYLNHDDRDEEEAHLSGTVIVT